MFRYMRHELMTLDIYSGVHMHESSVRTKEVKSSRSSGVLGNKPA